MWESWPIETPFLSWDYRKSTFCDQIRCLFCDCELFSSGVVWSRLTLIFGRERNYKSCQKHATCVGKVDPTLPQISRGMIEKVPSATKLECTNLDCELFSSRVVWSRLTLIFGRERNYKSCQKHATCVGKLTHRDPISLVGCLKKYFLWPNDVSIPRLRII